jgi:hypothetical protein
MALTSKEIEQIAKDEMRGVKPTIKGKDADEFRKRFAVDMALAKEKGWIIELPFEIPE